MLPFELVATATDSPRDSPGGSLRKFDTAVNGMSGTPVIVAFACANAGPTASVRTAHAEARIRVIERPSHAGSLYQLHPWFNGSRRGLAADPRGQDLYVVLIAGRVHASVCRSAAEISCRRAGRVAQLRGQDRRAITGTVP